MQLCLAPYNGVQHIVVLLLFLSSLTLLALAAKPPLKGATCGASDAASFAELRAAASVHLQMHNTPAAVACLRRALRPGTVQSAADATERLAARRELAVAYELDGRLPQAASEAEAALAEAQAQGDDDQVAEALEVRNRGRGGRGHPSRPSSVGKETLSLPLGSERCMA